MKFKCNGRWSLDIDIVGVSDDKSEFHFIIHKLDPHNTYVGQMSELSSDLQEYILSHKTPFTLHTEVALVGISDNWTAGLYWHRQTQGDD